MASIVASEARFGGQTNIVSSRNGNPAAARRSHLQSPARAPAQPPVAPDPVQQLRTTLQHLRAAQEELVASRSRIEDRARYRDLFEFAPDGYLVTDRHGRIIEANIAAARLLNLPARFITGKPLTLYVHPTERTEVYGRLLRMRSGHTADWTLTMVPRGSETRVFHVTVSIDGSSHQLPAKLKWLLRDVTAKSQDEQQLRESHRGLRSMASRLALAEERERRRIATDIHDHIGQSLAVCKLRLGMLRESLDADQLSVVDEVRALLSQIIEQTRTLTFELSPTVLYELGLGAAIEWLLDQRNQFGVAFEFTGDRSNHRLERKAEIILFQTVRELLTNVIKHARATRATVRLDYDPKVVSIEIEDNGVGFDPAAELARRKSGPSLGLFSVRERMEHLNGLAEITSAPGFGTRIRLTAPLRKRGRHNKSKAGQS